ncbi:response regulator transcription factor [Sphingomonas paucimobilis]|uniref:response regulator transcription factor n=1 Tax=Sphingomonas paucimobilis TaxID=13689 RepID=UPI0030F4C173
MRLLLVEDDLALAESLLAMLGARGLGCDHLATGKDALHALATMDYDLVLLDLGLPDLDGMALLRILRAQGDRIPLIALTARSALADRVAGLSTGADDFIIKPFEAEELIARIRALLRRHAGAAQAAMTMANVRFDLDTGDLEVDGRPISLAARDRDMLRLLFRRPGKVVGKQLAEGKLFGLDDPAGSNAVEVYLYRLRKKLADAGAKVRVETIRGVGFMLREET